MKRRLLYATVALAAVLVGAYALLWLTAPPERIDRATFERLRVGMTEGEVEELIGAPPGDYTRDPPEPEPPRVLNDEPRLTLSRWAGPDGRIVVFFDHQGRIQEKEFWGWVPGDPFAPQSRSLLARLRRGLGITP